jgi:DNA-binding FrmR family transcriptional regulator
METERDEIMDCAQDGACAHHRGSYQNNKRKIVNGLRRVEGQVRGMQRMVEEERYCVDVLNQIAAARAGLARLAMIILEDHAHGCLTKAILEQQPAGGQGEPAIEEIMSTVKRLLK